MSPPLQYASTKSGISIPGRAQWTICNKEQRKIGFLNIYVPNNGKDRATFWAEISSSLPQADSWIVGSDINMVKEAED